MADDLKLSTLFACFAGVAPRQDKSKHSALEFKSKSQSKPLQQI